MNIFERVQRQLALDYANSLKVAVLFFIHAGGWFALDAIGVHDLASPWLVLTLTPNILIYVLERLGRITWFRGMNSPSLLVMALSIAMIFVLNTSFPVPNMLAYCVLAGWIASFGFLMFRMWTFGPPVEATN
jgi:hypothetical protein